MESVNIKKLAQILNLSISTVSKALRDSHDISAETKKKVILELSEGLMWMNLVVSFSPESTQNIRHIGFQEIIYFDGLSKDRIMNAITRTLTAYGYVVTVLQKYNIPA